MNKNKLWQLRLTAALLAVNTLTVFARPEQEYIPHSGVLKSEQLGKKVRTHFRVQVPEEGHVAFNARIASQIIPYGKPPYLGLGYETPASLACIYNLVTAVKGCEPNSVTTVSKGGSKAIALVTAYHYPHALSDLQKFSMQFGLPTPNLTVVFANNSQPANDPNGWETEAALDLQWSHAMAPNAQQFLVEAASSNDNDMFDAVDIASTLVSAAGGGQVSMSWGGSEFSGQTAFDDHFTTPGITYLASSGDAAGTGYPCTSPNVVCVGGTTLRRNPDNRKLIAEVAWADAGSGLSTIYSRPSFQDPIANLVGNFRGVPDISLASDSNTGAWLLYTPSNTGKAGWYIAGGTSWAAPTLAGIMNATNSFYDSSQSLLSDFYAGIGSFLLRDIKSGWCGYYSGLSTNVGWDKCTGLGVPKVK